MKTTVEYTKKWTLELTDEEVQWLNGVMQNPLHGEGPTEEASKDQEMRRRFYEGTTMPSDPT